MSVRLSTTHPEILPIQQSAFARPRMASRADIIPKISGVAPAASAASATRGPPVPTPRPQTHQPTLKPAWSRPRQLARRDRTRTLAPSKADSVKLHVPRPANRRHASATHHCLLRLGAGFLRKEDLIGLNSNGIDWWKLEGHGWVWACCGSDREGGYHCRWP